MANRRRRLLTQILVVALVIEVGLPLALYGFRNKVIFFPRNDVPPASRLRAFTSDVDARVIQIRRPDGRELAAYDARPTKPPAPDSPVVLFLHGNGGDIAMRAPLLSWLVQNSGLRWVLPDYSGYGGNPGSPSEEEVCADGVAAFDALVAEGVAPERIVVYGESLGGAVALHVATERKPAGVVVQSSFASLGSMAGEVYPWLPLAGLLARGAFPSAKRIADLAMPVVVVHGSKDRIIPPRQGEKLHAAAPEGTEFLRIQGARHNDLFEAAGPEYVRDLAARFRRWAGPPPAQDPR